MQFFDRAKIYVKAGMAAMARPISAVRSCTVGWARWRRWWPWRQCLFRDRRWYEYASGLPLSSTSYRDTRRARQRQKMHGAKGQDLYLKVPAGTVYAMKKRANWWLT